MAERRRLLETYHSRYLQAPGTNHFPRQPEGLPSSDLLENRIAFQAAEIDRLTQDNRRLVFSLAALRDELISAQREAKNLKAHIRSIDIESDIQIRVLLDRIMEAEVGKEAHVNKEFQQAQLEAQSLIKARDELTSKIQNASEELQKLRADAKVLPELIIELENSKQEHQRLRAEFEYEKGSNIEQVKQLKEMERKMIGMVREIEKLRADVLNTNNRAAALGPRPPPAGIYYDEYGRPIGHTVFNPSAGLVMPYISSHAQITHSGPCHPSFVQ